MFLVDKYIKDSNVITCHQPVLQYLLDTFDAHNQIYDNINNIVNKPLNEFKEVINDLEKSIWRYSNFQHIIVYGKIGCGKENIVNKLLEKIYGKINVKLKNVEYVISGYGNTKTKVQIKQSKYHIVIEPNGNGFDKYLIQEIIQNYAKTELLNILKYKKLFKIVVINKIDNLSYYAQASLRRTMEKYADTCKFIFICDQLSNIIEPIRSRCLLIRVPLPNKYQITDTLLTICDKEDINIPAEKLKNIIGNSDNKINLAIWLLEMYKIGIDRYNNWELLIDEIINMLNDKDNYNLKNTQNMIKNILSRFYILFITNIPTQEIIRKIMLNLIKTKKNIKLKLRIIEITSIFEQRISQGTRHIIHIEAYIIRLIYLLNNQNKGKNYHYNLDNLEI
jgi:replication factor C subunit 3/5